MTPEDAPVTQGEDVPVPLGYGLFQKIDPDGNAYLEAEHGGDNAPVDGLDNPPSTVDSVGSDLSYLATTADLQNVSMRLDNLLAMHADLHAKVDHLAQGIGLIYGAVDHLVKMLSAVQQVASMMPGGKRIANAMAQQQNGGQQ